MSLYCDLDLGVLSSFAITLLRERERERDRERQRDRVRAGCFASLCLLYRVAVFVLCLFLLVPLVGLWYVIVAFSVLLTCLLYNFTMQFMCGSRGG